MQIMYDILSELEDKAEGITRTPIMYKANLSHDMLNQYLNEGLTFGFFVQKGRHYSITERGHAFLRKMREIAALFQTPNNEGDLIVIH